MRNLIIVLGDQLSLKNPALEDVDPTEDRVLMVESPLESTHVWSHKARIAMFLSAMRHFREALREVSIEPIYLLTGQHPYVSLMDAWHAYILQLQPQKIVVCEPGDYRVLQMLKQVAALSDVPLVVRDDTHFMCSQSEFKHWAGKNQTLRMEFFYRYMRKKHHVLMQQDGQPLGGAWNYDEDNRQAFSKQGPVHAPQHQGFKIDTITHETFADVEHFYHDHPGQLLPNESSRWMWPVTRDQALQALDTFIHERLAMFGVHQDAMWHSADPSHAYLWHALLSSSLNLKLLHPLEVIQKAEQAYLEKQLPLASVEGFVRQILGWREFIRGVYWLDMPEMATKNTYQHSHPLPIWYWTGHTHMQCMRQTINQILSTGYAHHIQRLMVTGMFGVLAELLPSQVSDWYLAMFVDAVEWVELPNVIGMALHANGGRFTSKPYIASGAYIKRMSNYCHQCRYRPDIKTGPNACPVTSLYWRFLIKHYDAFSANPRTALMIKHVDKMTEAEKTAISEYGEQLLHRLDQL